MISRRSVLLGAFTVPALAAIAPRKAQAAQHTVRIQSMRFSPAKLSIKAGDTVVFDNRGPMEHTATAVDDSWDTGNLRRGNSASITFTDKGEFKYICRWHSEMRGTIVVE